MDSNEMMENKQTIIGNLYSIRAGLSYISDLADQFRKTKSDTEKDSSLIDNKMNFLPQMRREMSSTKTMDRDLQEKAAKKEKDLASKRKDLEYTKKNDAKNLLQIKKRPLKQFGQRSFVKFFLSLFLSLASIAGCVVLYLVGKETASEYMFWPALGFSIWAIVMIVRNHKERKVCKHNKKERIKEFEAASAKDIGNMERECERLELVIKGLYADAERAHNNMDKNVKNHEKKIEAIKQEIEDLKVAVENGKERMVALKKEGTAVYESLVDTYGDFFHPDNWKYLDRVVYYLSTGRAESIREALNLMDQRLNAEMIASEIRASSQMISGDIRRASRAITSAVAVCAERICDQIGSAQTAIVSGLDRVASTNRAIAKEMGVANEIASAQVAATNRLVSAQELNNSLQRKSNRTMEQLLSDYQVVNNRVHY